MGVKRAKNGPKWQKIMLITLHISETIQNMIVIYWAHKQNDNFSWCFFVFHFSKFWFFWIGRGLSGKKWSRITKNPVFQAPNLRNHLSYDCHLWHTCKMIIYPGIFFHFLKILIFWVVREVKGQKTVQDDKIFSLLQSISQEPYIIWLLFMVRICQMIISLGVFLIFWKFCFLRLLIG